MEKITRKHPIRGIRTLVPGIVLSVLVSGLAVVAEWLEVRLTGGAWIEALVLAILVGAVVRLLLRRSERFDPGIAFSAKYFLEIAIVLLGASVSAAAIRGMGLPLVGAIAVVVAAVLTASYGIDTPIGRASFNGSFSQILNLQRSLTATSPLFDAIDTIGNQVSERGRFSASLNHGPFTGNLTANYVGSYLNNATITVAGVRYPDTKIPSWTTFDFGLTYKSPAEAGPLQDLRLALNIQNIEGKDPPIVLSGANAVDLNNHNIFGRVWTFEVSKRF